MKKYKIGCVFILFLTTIICCVEPFDIKSLEYENFLVVEATITDENKKQEIKLSRTFEVDSLGPRPEVNAKVFLLDGSKTQYNFIEESNGLYTSNLLVDKNKTYTLKIETSNGEYYSSSSEKLTNPAQINAVEFEIGENNLEEKRIFINVSSFNPNNNSNYYRYKYEETYKIIAPYWSSYSIKIISDFEFLKELSKTNSQICYKTLYSKESLQTETSSLNEDRVVKFPIKLIYLRDFKISHRYSILVKQYVQTANAYNYYKTLNNFSSNKSFFSQVQTGFLQGNLSSEKNIKNKVVGFFELSSVSKKRLFFNRGEISPLIPDYINDCEFIAPRLNDLGGSPLLAALKNDYVYYDDNDLGLDHLEGPYLLVKKPCADCKELGTNIKPSFWID